MLRRLRRGATIRYRPRRSRSRRRCERDGAFARSDSETTRDTVPRAPKAMNHTRGRVSLPEDSQASNRSLRNNHHQEFAVSSTRPTRAWSAETARTQARTLLRRRRSPHHDRTAILTASSIAAFMLPASARSLPAMSKAVPWSGLVRGMGRPTVMLTARSHAMVLRGMRP